MKLWWNCFNMCVCVCVCVSQNSVDESTYVGVCLGVPGLMKLELVCMCVCLNCFSMYCGPEWESVWREVSPHALGFQQSSSSLLLSSSNLHLLARENE